MIDWSRPNNSAIWACVNHAVSSPKRTGISKAPSAVRNNSMDVCVDAEESDCVMSRTGDVDFFIGDNLFRIHCS